MIPTLRSPKSSPANLLDIVSDPSLLSPYHTTIALDLIILNNLLPGLPGHISPVKDPSSANPNPMWGYILVSSPSLSKPADKPIGFL